MVVTSPSEFIDLKGIPFLGSVVPISRNALEFFTNTLRERGDRIRMRVLGRNVLLLSHPEDMEQVLIRDQESYGRSAEIRKLAPIFGNGLLASEGDAWRCHRRILQPSFRHEALVQYASIMLSVIRRQTAHWVDQSVLDIHHEAMLYTRETICAVLFGEHFTREHHELGEAVSTVFGGLRSEVLYLPIWRRLPLKRSREWSRAVETLNTAIRQVITDRKNSTESGTDLLSALIAASGEDGSHLPLQQIHDEILTFFLAGHETAALGLTWAIYLLAANPETQRRVKEEVQDLSRQHCGLTPAAFTQLPWTMAVVKEALRLYPPAWSMGRKAIRDTTLGGSSVKKNTDVWLCLYQLHRDPRWFENADAFLPERWIDAPNPKPFTYIPFGIGPRVCIGQHFAMMEIVLGLAEILDKFHIARSSLQNPELSAWITLRPKEPIRVRVRRDPSV